MKFELKNKPSKICNKYLYRKQSNNLTYKNDKKIILTKHQHINS